MNLIIWEIHGFCHQLRVVREMQQNSLYGENLGNWYSYLSTLENFQTCLYCIYSFKVYDKSIISLLSNNLTKI